MRRATEEMLVKMELMVKIKMEKSRRKAAYDSVDVDDIKKALSERFEDVKFEISEASMEDVTTYFQDKVSSLERRVSGLETHHKRY